MDSESDNWVFPAMALICSIIMYLLTDSADAGMITFACLCIVLCISRVLSEGLFLALSLLMICFVIATAVGWLLGAFGGNYIELYDDDLEIFKINCFVWTYAFAVLAYIGIIIACIVWANSTSSSYSTESTLSYQPTHYKPVYTPLVETPSQSIAAVDGFDMMAPMSKEEIDRKYAEIQRRETAKRGEAIPQPLQKYEPLVPVRDGRIIWEKRIAAARNYGATIVYTSRNPSGKLFTVSEAQDALETTRLNFRMNPGMGKDWTEYIPATPPNRDGEI